jgi:hypothetical protein
MRGELLNGSPAQQKTGIREGAPAYRRSKVLAAFAVVMLSGVFLASVFLSLPPAGSNGPYLTICGFKNFTGLPCPGCGLTHSFCALGKGDLAGAFGFNLLGPPLFLLLALVWVRSACVLSDRREPVAAFDRMAERIQLVRGFLIAFAVFGAARIIYLLIRHPELVRDSPLSRLGAGLFH